MRCFGSTNEYTTGVVFALPESYGNETEDEAATRTRTWSWPAGYAAKTEFNIDSYGNLINGREEALVPISELRRHNHDYITKEDYKICGRLVKGGLQKVPYNEVFLRVGGLGRVVRGRDVATGERKRQEDGTGRSMDRGVGLPVALFVRTATYGHLISLLRNRARATYVLGKKHMSSLPLLLISPTLGVRVLTQRLEDQLLHLMSDKLNPFQNLHIAHKTTMSQTDEGMLQQKMEELLDLDSFRKTLTPEERARLAGGFGATDDSVAHLLMEAKQVEKNQPSRLQDIVNEGLAAAVRSGDYHTSRQLLILYTLVASTTETKKQDDDDDDLQLIVVEKSGCETTKKPTKELQRQETPVSSSSSSEEAAVLTKHSLATVDKQSIPPPPPPPPPLDTDRLRSATNSDGLLAVLGAAEVLKAMQDGSAKRRVMECVVAIEE